MEAERKKYWLDLAKLILPRHQIPLPSNDIHVTWEELWQDMLNSYPVKIDDEICGFYLYDAEDLILYELYETLNRHTFAGWSDVENVQKNNFRGPDWYFFKGFAGDRDGPGEWWFETLTEQREEFEKYVQELEEIKLDFVMKGSN